MANIRAMAIFQGFTNLPEDRYVNTWHFSNALAFDGHDQIVDAALAQFYNTATAGGNAVGAHLSPVVLDNYSIKVYDLEDPEPRIPVEFFHTLPTRESGVGLPEEVAVVMSFHGEPPISGRRRGRIYLGPLNNASTTSSDADSFTSVSEQLSTCLRQAGERLIGFESVGEADWCIRSSRPTENFVRVVGGWVDGALDTQRRRGPTSTSRLLFPIA